MPESAALPEFSRRRLLLSGLVAGRLAARPGLPIWTNKDVAALLEGSGATVHVIGDGDAFTAGGIKVHGHGEWHAPIHPDVTRVRNTGFQGRHRTCRGETAPASVP